MIVRRTLAVGAAALAAATLSVAVPSASAAPTTRYTVDERVCPQPTKPLEFTCFAIRQRAATAATPGAKAVQQSSVPVWAHGPSGGLSPRALSTAYHFDPNSGGTYQTVGIVDWYDDPNILSDLNAFDRHYGFPTETSTSFRKVNEFGNASPLPKKDTNAAVEITLDVQAVRAVCHKCRILLVEASQPQAWNLARAENTAARMHATEISNSFGTYETRGRQFPDWLRAAFAHAGVVITASTGDDGWYGWDFANDPGSGVPGTAAFPSTSAAVVAVGGTKLNLDSTGHRATEPIWNDNALDDSVGRVRGPRGATGSGCSVLIDAPAWQTDAPNYAYSGCQGKRFTADVSADAAPATGLDIYDTYGAPGWITVGGTSLSAPLIAGMWAVVGGSGGVQHPAQSLYQNRKLRPNLSYDVVSGGSSWCGGDTIDGCSAAVYRLSGGYTRNPNVYESARVDCSYPLYTERADGPPRNLSCNAAHGLDGPTGVGTPNDLRMFRPPAPVVTIVPPTRPVTGMSQTYRSTVYDPVPNAHAAQYLWFWGDHTAPTRTTSSATTHTYATQGTFTIQLTVTDSVGQQTTVTKSVTARK